MPLKSSKFSGAIDPKVIDAARSMCQQRDGLRHLVTNKVPAQVEPLLRLRWLWRFGSEVVAKVMCSTPGGVTEAGTVHDLTR